MYKLMDRSIFGEARHLAKQLAKESGAKKLTFSSLRPGWEQVAPEQGFKPVKWAAEV